MQDEHLAVTALWKPPLVPELWPAPAWLLGPTLPGQQGVRPGRSSGSGSTSSSSSSSEEESESESSGGSGSSSSSEEESESESSSSGEEEAEGCSGGQAGAPAQAGAGREGGASEAAEPLPEPPEAAPALTMFDELDQIFMRGAGRASNGNGGRSGGSAGGGRSGNAAPPSTTRLSVLERLRAGQGQQAAGSSVAPTRAGTPAGAKGGAAAAAAAAAAAPRRRPVQPQQPPRPALGQLAAAAAEAGGGGSKGAEPKVYVVGGKPYRELAGAPGISAWVHDKLSSRAHALAPSAPGSGSGGGDNGSGSSSGARPGAAAGRGGLPEALLGYLCHIKATDQLLLVAGPGLRGQAVRQLQAHPAVERLRQQGSR